MQTQEQSIIERIKASRGTTEPSTEAPTENTEAVNVSEDTPVEEEQTEAPAEVLETETEEPAEEVAEVEASEVDQDLFYYEIDGEEVSSEQLSKWKSEGLMQADYTRKTQELADSRKAFDDQQAEFTAKQSELNDKLATLEAIINEETPSAETLQEWREYEPEKYIEHTEKMSNRKKLLAESKAELPTRSVDMAKVSADLFAAHPEWMENGKQSKQFTEDTTLMTKYAESRGIGQEELFTFEAKHYEVMLDAARYQTVNKKNAAIEKKVRKAPVSTRPKQQVNNAQHDEIKKLEARLKSQGRPEDFVKLRQLKRQLNK